MFVCTANTLNIPPALLDRMETIRLSGYTEDEKVNIALKHLLPKLMKNHGLKPEELAISESAVRDIIRYYTREAGVRALERGLAWTEVGGELLTIEAAIMPGKGKMTTTGKLGEVMQESVQAALSVVRSRSRRLGIPADFYQKNDIHIHLPEGATPKDGPSAGIGICTAMVSALTGIPVRSDVAMTGEITLRGEVLQIGGLKEKLLAAHRGGIKTVLIPEENVKDLAEIPDNIKNRLDIHPVKWIDSVFDMALERKTEPLSEDDAAPALPPVTEAPAPAAVKH
jgi:ATP-dependent Lon protease